MKVVDNVKDNAEQRYNNVMNDFGDLKSSVSGAYHTAIKDNPVDATIDLAKDLYNTLLNGIRRSAGSNRSLIGK